MLGKGTALPLANTFAASNFEPDYVGADADGPVLAIDDQELSVRTRRWRFPSWKDGGKTITNIRNLDSSWWCGVNGEYITQSRYRCLIPFDRFAEWDAREKANAWFTIAAPQAFFAGFWRPWTGERLKAVEGKKRREQRTSSWELFAFMTIEPNATVAAIHPKAMPTIVTTPEEAGRWLGGGIESLDLQRPLPDDMVERSGHGEF